MQKLLIPWVLVALLIAGCKSEARQHFEKADELVAHKDYQGARQELDKSIALEPGNLDAQKSLARLAELTGDEQTALKAYQAASKLDPKDQQLAAKTSHYKELDQLRKDADAAVGEVETGDPEKGMQALIDVLHRSNTKSTRQKAVESIQKSAAVLKGKGDSEAAAGNYSGALASYQLAVRAHILLAGAGDTQLDAAAEPVMTAMGEAAKKAQAVDSNTGILNDVLAADPTNKTANIELARIDLSKAPPDYATAADLYERAGAPAPEVAELRRKAERQRRHAGNWK